VPKGAFENIVSLFEKSPFQQNRLSLTSYHSRMSWPGIGTEIALRLVFVFYIEPLKLSIVDFRVGPEF
jgi:hypothetical protein